MRPSTISAKEIVELDDRGLEPLEVIERAALQRELHEETKALLDDVRGWRESVPLMGNLPALVNATEAAKILGIDVEAFRSRVKRGQVPERCIYRTGRKTSPGKRGGNAGRVQYVRDELVKER